MTASTRVAGRGRRSQGVNLLDRVQGGVRRFTGPRWLPAGGIPPPTTFYGEPTPPLTAVAWRLRVDGRVATPLSPDLPQLARLGKVEREAVLDCTSGLGDALGWSRPGAAGWTGIEWVERTEVG